MVKTSLTFLGALALVCVALIAVAAGVVYSGSYNIAAGTGHSKPVEAAVHELMVRSVRSHAREVVVPAEINFHDQALVERAAGHYRAMCQMCHGAPGQDADRWSQALYPPPPDLVHALREHQWSDAEVFWILKHGIKDTGMAAFGDSHGDEDLWELTALVRQLPQMAPDEYRAILERAGAQDPTGGRGPASEPPHTHTHKH